MSPAGEVIMVVDMGCEGGVCIEKWWEEGQS